jgi:hopanoid biosynthesis associated RND transporter like protein HpnN
MAGERRRQEARLERRLAGLLRGWMDASRRRARTVLLASALATLGFGAYAAAHLGIDTRHTALLDDDLPFWRHYNDFASVFPILDEALLVVVDGETPGRAREAASLLAERLSAQPELFRDVYVPGGDPFFEREALLYLSVDQLEQLTTDLARVQPLLAELSRDGSLSNLARVLEQGIDRARDDPDLPVNLAAAFDSLSVAADAVLEGRSHPISWIDMLVEGGLPSESSRRVIVLEPVYDYDRLLPGRIAMQTVRDAAAELSLTPENGVRVRITGNVALNTEEMVLIAKQVMVMGLLSFVAIAGILAVALRSLRLVLAILLTLLVGLVATAAFAGLAVGHLNVVSIAFAILFVGLGVDFGIHLSMHYAEQIRAGEEHAAAIRETAGSVGVSLVLCAATTAIGFYVFVPTDYRAVGELGLIAGTGMLISLVTTLSVLPALLSLGDLRRVGSDWPGARWIVQKLVHLSLTHARAVRVASLVLGVAGLCLLPFVHFDFNVVEMRDPSTESVQTFNALLEESHTSPWTIDVMEPDLATAVAMAKELAKLPEVERAVTLADYVPRDQEEKLEILTDMAFFLPEVSPRTIERRASVPDQIQALRSLRDSLNASWLLDGEQRRRESALRAELQMKRLLDMLETLERREEAKAVAAFERSLTGELNAEMARLWRAADPKPVTLESLPRDLARRMVADDGRARVEVLPSEDLSDNAAHARFVDHVRELAPQATGSAVTILEWGRAVVRAFVQALTSALVAIALLLWLLWRRVSHMALVLVPLLLAAVWTAAGSVLLGISFNFANVVVIPLLLGVGVDSGIHLVHRHRLALAIHPDRPASEGELLGSSTARAVLVSALTTMGSFGSLALVTHPGIRSLGELLLVGVTFTLISNLVVLPALIARSSDRPERVGLAESPESRVR